MSGIPVLEVTGPDPASRRAKGKDDTLDAIAVAEAARTRRRVQVAKDRSGAMEALRVLSTMSTPLAARMSRIALMRVVLPTPGPPVTTMALDARARRMASAWLVANDKPVFGFPGDVPVDVEKLR